MIEGNANQNDISNGATDTHAQKPSDFSRLTFSKGALDELMVP